MGGPGQMAGPMAGLAGRLGVVVVVAAASVLAAVAAVAVVTGSAGAWPADVEIAESAPLAADVQSQLGVAADSSQLGIAADTSRLIVAAEAPCLGVAADSSQLGVAAVAESTLREGPDGAITDAFAHRLFLDQEVFAWPDGAGAGGLDSGIGIIALPNLTKNWDESRRSTKIAITNMAYRPGFTDFVIVITDQNGMLDYVGEKLNERQTEFIDLDTWGYVNKGFVGSAMISATFWEHDLFSDDGEFVRNALGLSAAISDWSTFASSHPGTGAGVRGVPYDTSLGIPVSPWKSVRPPAHGSRPAPAPEVTATPGPSSTASATPTVTPTPTTTPTPLVPPPYAPNSPELLLPALAWRDTDAPCEVSAGIQNAGAEEAVGALVLWGEPGECGAATCAGPLAVQCTDAIKWDGRWHIDTDELPAEARSGVLFSFNTKTAREAGIAPHDGVVADMMCAMLAASLPGNCLAYESFKEAYDQGLDYLGAPQNLVWGAPLAIQVERRCEGPAGGPSLPLYSAYTGIWGPNVGYGSTDVRGYQYSLPIANGAPTGKPSVAHIQNAGDACASFEVRSAEMGSVGPSRACAAIELEAGAAAMVDLSACVAESGSAWIESDEPLAVVVDSTSDLAMNSYVGAPPSLADMHGRPLLSASGAIALAPTVYSNYFGWTTDVTMQNTGAISSVLRVSLIDRSGNTVAARQLGPVAPGASVAVDVPAITNVPSQWVGSFLIESFPASEAPVATPWLGPEPTAPHPGPPPFGGWPTRTPGLPVPVTPGTPEPTPTPSATTSPMPTSTPLLPSPTPTPTPNAVHLPYCEG